MQLLNVNASASIVFYMMLVTLAGRGSTACPRIMINGHGVTQGDKTMILGFHNRMRQAIAMGAVSGQPPASNMLEMKWDEELAQHAQKWSTSCLSESHDRRRHLQRFLVGQNIATRWTYASPTNTYDMMANFAQAISSWFDEYKHYRYGPFTGSPSTGHYTQMIWADSDLIGCGYSYYLDMRKGFTKNYVCNYGKSGNVIGEYPYAKGYPRCERFNLMSSYKYTGLCESPASYFGLQNHI